MNILTIVDNQGWCWSSTAHAVAQCLPHHRFSIVAAKEYLTSPSINPDDFDLTWCRGYPQVIERKIPRNKPWIATIATGGTRLAGRIEDATDPLRSPSLWGIVTQCKSALDAVSAATNKRVVMIPNGVDLDLFHPAAHRKRKTKVGMAANTRTMDRAELKGAPYMEAACRTLGIDFSIVGDLPRHELAEWYRTLTIYCQPSRAEGCSNSVLEAMASGLPCLIVDGVGYFGEICRDGVNAVFVKRTPKAIAEAISALRFDRKLKRAIGEGARRLAEEHSWPSIATRFDAIFREAAAMEIRKETERMDGLAVRAMADGVVIADRVMTKGEVIIVSLSQLRMSRDERWFEIVG